MTSQPAPTGSGPRTTPWWRRVTAAALVIAPTVLLLTWSRAQLDVLPETIASHWGGSGTADGFSSARANWLGLTIGAGVAAVVALAVVGLRNSWVRVATLTAAAWVTAFCLGIWWSMAEANLAVTDPHEARLGWQLWAAIAGSLIWAVAVYLVHGRARTALTLVQNVTPAAVVPGEHLSATASVTSRALAWVAGALGVLGVALVVAGTAGGTGVGGTLLVAGIVGLLAAAVVAAFASVRVTADDRGLRIVSWLGPPLVRVPLRDITAVRTAEIDPAQWGGWGLRVMPGRTAYVVRRGPGLVVARSSGRQLAVTLPDPEPVASVLAALIPAAGPERAGDRPGRGS